MSLCISHSDDMYNDPGHHLVDKEDTEHLAMLPEIWLDNHDFQPHKDGLESSRNNQENPTNINLSPMP